MKASEFVSLAPHTTFRIGGSARFFISATSNAEVAQAIVFAREHSIPLLPLGSGSNILVPDEGVNAVVLKMPPSEIIFESNGDETILSASAGTSWGKVVDAASGRGLWGIENLAGIPGTLGGAVVQNIGAYGVELENVFAWAEVVDASGQEIRLRADSIQFAYRDSLFKRDPAFIILRVGLRVSSTANPRLAYADLKRARETGRSLKIPGEIAETVRIIRAGKFPNLSEEGTAGSFFKNPVLVSKHAQELAKRYPELPQFLLRDGTVKIPLAWILDHVLNLKGFSLGPVRLYEKQPLVIVAGPGARAADVEVLAEEIIQRIYSVIGVSVEREVESFGSRARCA